MSEKQFKEAYERIRLITGCNTQEELAGYFGIRQSSISDAKRRGAVPDGWLVTLVEKEGVNPAWIRDGVGPERLAQRTVLKAALEELSLEVLLREVRQRCIAVSVTL